MAVKKGTRTEQKWVAMTRNRMSPELAGFHSGPGYGAKHTTISMARPCAPQKRQENGETRLVCVFAFFHRHVRRRAVGKWPPRSRARTEEPKDKHDTQKRDATVVILSLSPFLKHYRARGIKFSFSQFKKIAIVYI